MKVPQKPPNPNTPSADVATQQWVNTYFQQALRQKGGVSTQTPGAVTTVTIPHGLGSKPSWYSAQPASANARGAPAFYLSADNSNIILNFASALTAATAYSWVWVASA